MMMVELTGVPGAALPVAELAEHLRLSSGFADDGSQDALLARALRAAIAAIEARTGKALIARGFALTLDGWQTPAAQVLPIAPVLSIGAVRLVTRTGAEVIVDPDRYSLRPDAHRPEIVATASLLPQPATGGSVVIEFVAGFAAVWSGVPADLQQAGLALAAAFYDRAGESPAPLPQTVLALLQPHRPLRLSGRPA